MGTNNDGYSGVEIEQIALEKNVLVGVQSPNLNPSIKVDVNGKSLPKAVITPNVGMSIEPDTGFDCSYADTSWLNHGGIYSVTSGNKMNFTTGAGGFEMTTAGPAKFNTAFQDFFCNYAFNINTRLFTVASTERTHLMGTRIDIDYEKTYITGNVNFLNNVAMAGSLFVNGELYCTHITTHSQTNFTDYSAELSGYINPGQSFAVFSGASSAAKALGAPQIICSITIPFPDPISKVLTLPCKIAFPNGISLISDATFANQPNSSALVAQAETRPAGAGINLSDVFGPGHNHSYKSGAFNFADNTSSVYQQAGDMMESKTPSKAKSTIPNGMQSFEQFKNQIQEDATKTIKGWLSKMWSLINPFCGGSSS